MSRTTVRKTAAKAKLSDVKLDEISFVGKGDNKGAHILLLKGHPNPVVALGKEYNGDDKGEILQKWMDDKLTDPESVLKEADVMMFADILTDREIRDKVWGYVWMLEDSICSILCDESGEDKSEMIQSTVDQFKTAISALTKQKGGKEDMPKKMEDMEKELQQATEKVAGLEKQVADLTKQNEDLKKQIPQKEELIDKSKLDPAVRKQLEDLETINKNNTAAIEKMQDEAATTEAISKAALIPSISAEGVDVPNVLKSLKKSAPDQFDGIFNLLKAADARIKEGGLFTEIGKNKGGEGASAYDQLVAKATDLRKTMPELSDAQAFDRVYKSETALRTQYLEEQKANRR